jgi:hypothetical protein
MNLTRKEADSLAEMVRTIPTEAHDAVLWAVKHHVALFLYGIERAPQTIHAILTACSTHRDDGIVKRIGLERLLECKGTDFLEIEGVYSSDGRLRITEPGDEDKTF